LEGEGGGATGDEVGALVLAGQRASLFLSLQSSLSRFPWFCFRLPPFFCSSAVLDIYRQENTLATPRVIVQPLGYHLLMAHRGRKMLPRSLPFLLNRDGGDEQQNVNGYLHFDP